MVTQNGTVQQRGQFPRDAFGSVTRRKLLAASALAGAGATAPVGVLLGLVHAHQATPSAAPAADEAAFFVQFVHFEKYFASFGVTLDAEQLAPLYGLDAATYGEIRNEFDANARRAAEELLAEPGFADRVAGLPFAPGDTVAGIGDSITDDLQSWLEILRHLLELQRPGDGIQVFNEGISGDTTTDVLLRFIPIILEQPAWILCFLGTNDAVRYGRQPTKTLVSPNSRRRSRRCASCSETPRRSRPGTRSGRWSTPSWRRCSGRWRSSRSRSPWR